VTATSEQPDAGTADWAEEIRAAATRIAALGESSRRPGRYPVNQPMIDHWLTALESYRPSHSPDGSPGFAPPAMVQVWTMPGLRGQWDDDPLHSMMRLLDQAGYPAVVATNCEQIYHRYLRDGERVSVSARLDSVTGPKRTALGEGWFVTTRSTWFVDDEPVAEMLFRVLKFRPAPRPDPPESPAAPERRDLPAPPEPPDRPAANDENAGKSNDLGVPLRPVVSRDTAFFWAGTAVHELRIQHCPSCDALRHPPGPRCPACGSSTPGYLVAVGTGTVFSYVVHHRPPVSGRAAPFAVALVELTEGVRMLGELIGVDPLDPEVVRIGAPVEVTWDDVDETLTLPAWKLSRDRARIPGAGS
jgi:uncharacterized OB-fold protein